MGLLEPGCVLMYSVRGYTSKSRSTHIQSKIRKSRHVDTGAGSFVTTNGKLARTSGVRSEPS